MSAQETTHLSDHLRHIAWRLGRKLYCWARGDLSNEPKHNGEYWLLGRMIAGLDHCGTFLDVGANVGDWSAHALATARASDKEIRLFAFEPCASTRAILQNRFSAETDIEVCPAALSSLEGEADFYSSGAGIGTNSLSAVSGPVSERVRMTTMDSFLEQRGIERVTMVKIDTEGFDLDVLRGAKNTLAQGRIDLVQFEYNWRWLLNKSSLLDVFDFIKDKPYRLGKLVGNSIIVHDDWHFELDRFFENNYVLVLKGSAMEGQVRIGRFNASNVVVFEDFRP